MIDIDKEVLDELDKIFDNRYEKAINELRDCYIYYSSFAEDNIENYNKAQRCLRGYDYKGKYA